MNIHKIKAIRKFYDALLMGMKSKSLSDRILYCIKFQSALKMFQSDTKLVLDKIRIIRNHVATVAE